MARPYAALPLPTLPTHRRTRSSSTLRLRPADTAPFRAAQPASTRPSQCCVGSGLPLFDRMASMAQPTAALPLPTLPTHRRPRSSSTLRLRPADTALFRAAQPTPTRPSRCCVDSSLPLSIPHFRNPTSQDRCYFYMCYFYAHSRPPFMRINQSFLTVTSIPRRTTRTSAVLRHRHQVQTRSLFISLSFAPYHRAPFTPSFADGGYRDHSLFTCLLSPLLSPPVWLRATSHQLQDTIAIHSRR